MRSSTGVRASTALSVIDVLIASTQDNRIQNEYGCHSSQVFTARPISRITQWSGITILKRNKVILGVLQSIRSSMQLGTQLDKPGWLCHHGDLAQKFTCGWRFRKMRFIHIIHMVVIGWPLAERADCPAYILDGRWLWRREQGYANLRRYRRACQFARDALVKEAACHRFLEQRIARPDQMDIDQSLGQIRARLRDTKEDQPLPFIGRFSRLLHRVRRIQ